MHFVEVFDWSDDVRTNVSLVVESFQPPPHSGVAVLDELGFGAVHVFAVGVVGVWVDPLLDFDCAGAVVEAVGVVCGLGGDVADLAYEGDLEGREQGVLVNCFEKYEAKSLVREEEGGALVLFLCRRP